MKIKHIQIVSDIAEYINNQKKPDFWTFERLIYHDAYYSIIQN